MVAPSRGGFVRLRRFFVAGWLVVGSLERFPCRLWYAPCAPKLVCLKPASANPLVDALDSDLGKIGNLRKPQATPAEAEAKFWERFESALGSRSYDAIEKLVGHAVGEPVTVEAWRNLWRIVDAALSAEAQQAA